VFLSGCHGNTPPSGASGESEEDIPLKYTSRKVNLKIVGLAYFNAFTARNDKPLTGLPDLKPHYEADREKELTKALEDGAIVVLWGVDLKKPGNPDKVIAYERDPDAEGRRMVVSANGAVRHLAEESFKAAPRASDP
jgi:hypothetical protein